MPEKETKGWKSIKPKPVKNTFDDAIPEKNSRRKPKYKTKQKPNKKKRRR